jgi:hypothetical protein
MLRSHVGREEKEAIVSMLGRQARLSARQLIGDDRDILIAEVAFLFDQIADGVTTGSLPGQKGIEAVQRTGG